MKSLSFLIFILSFSSLGHALASENLVPLSRPMSLHLEAELTCENPGPGSWATYGKPTNLIIHGGYKTPLTMNLNDSSLEFDFEIEKGVAYLKLAGGERFQIGTHSYGQNFCSSTSGSNHTGKQEVYIDLDPQFQFLVDQNQLRSSCANRKKIGQGDLYITHEASGAATKLAKVTVGQGCEKMVYESAESSGRPNNFILMSLYFFFMGIAG